MGAAWLVGIAAALQLVDAVFGRNPLASAVTGALVVELGASRAGVAWSEGDEAGSRPRAPTLRERFATAAIGTWPVALAVTLTLACGALVGSASLELGTPRASLGLAAIRAAAVAVRDELLFRGLALSVARRMGAPLLAARIFGAAAGCAAIALSPGVTPESLILTFASGLLFAFVWERGAVAAVAAHATWTLLLGAGLHGALLDVTWKSGTLAEGPRAAATPAYLATGAVAIAMAAWIVVSRRRRAG
jgi:uncharacterized protein